MTIFYRPWMHPHTDKATFIAYQAAAKRIHFRNSPTDLDYALVALYQAQETNADMVQKMASFGSQLPVKATSMQGVRKN